MKKKKHPEIALFCEAISEIVLNRCKNDLYFTPGAAPKSKGNPASHTNTSATVSADTGSLSPAGAESHFPGRIYAGCGRKSPSNVRNKSSDFFNMLRINDL